jgi:hypothetical protein
MDGKYSTCTSQQNIKLCGVAGLTVLYLYYEVVWDIYVKKYEFFYCPEV